MSDTPQVVIACAPPVLFLDTPEAKLVAQHFTQRSVYTLRQYEKRGLRIHTIPGDSDDPERKKHGDRHFIVLAEYLKFLETISD